jgi:hypothetical protein
VITQQWGLISFEIALEFSCPLQFYKIVCSKELFKNSDEILIQTGKTRYFWNWFKILYESFKNSTVACFFYKIMTRKNWTIPIKGAMYLPYEFNFSLLCPNFSGRNIVREAYSSRILQEFWAKFRWEFHSHKQLALPITKSRNSNIWIFDGF